MLLAGIVFVGIALASPGIVATTPGAGAATDQDATPPALRGGRATAGGVGDRGTPPDRRGAPGRGGADRAQARSAEHGPGVGNRVLVSSLLGSPVDTGSSSKKKWQEAEKVFLAAWELNPTFDVAYNLGMAEYQLKKRREAAEYLSFALRHWPLINAVGKLHGLAKQRYEESRAQVVAVSVTASAAGAEVLVDGQVVGKSPLEGELFVEPGEHRVEARLAGVEFAGETVRGEKGATVKVELVLKPPPDEGKAEGATGKAAGNGAPSGAAAPEGKAVAVPPPPEEPRSMVPAIALGAASVVALGVGVGMTVASNDASSDADAQKKMIASAGGQCKRPPGAFAGECSELDSTLRRLDTFGNAARVVYGVSGALAIGALAYALWPHKTMVSSQRVRVLPEVGLGSARVNVLGAW